MRGGLRDRSRKVPKFASPPFAAAVACAFVLYLPIFAGSPYLSLLPAAVFAGAGIAIVSESGEGDFTYRGILLFAMACGFLLGGSALFCLSFDLKREFLGFRKEKVISYSGRLIEDSRPVKGGLRMLTMRIESVSSSFGEAGAYGRLRIFLNPGKGEPARAVKPPALDAGLLVKIRGNAETVEGEYLLFGDEEDLEALGWSGVFAELRSGIKASVLSAIDRIGGSGRGLFKALFLGVKDDLDTEETEAFKKSGCVHILALSGMHLSILAAILFFLLCPLLGKKTTMSISLLIIIFYVYITGIQASILRAAFMYGFYAIAVAVDRPADGMNLLSLSFLLAIGIDPKSAYTLSFILSYMALFGIFLLSSDLETLIRRWIPPSLAKPIAASIAAQIATSPVTALCFGTAYPGGILTTAASGPLVTVFMWTGMAATILSMLPLPLVGEFVGLVLSIVYRILMAIITLGGRLPQILLGSDDLKTIFVIALALLVFLLYVGMRTRIFRRRSGWKNPTTILPPN